MCAQQQTLHAVRATVELQHPCTVFNRCSCRVASKCLCWFPCWYGCVLPVVYRLPFVPLQWWLQGAGGAIYEATWRELPRVFDCLWGTTR